MAYEMTTLPGSDDGSHEYDVIRCGKYSGPQLVGDDLEETYEIPDDVTPHPSSAMPPLKTTPTPEAIQSTEDVCVPNMFGDDAYINIAIMTEK